MAAVVGSEAALIFGHLYSHQLASLFLAHVGRLLENEMCDQQLTPASIEETELSTEYYADWKSDFSGRS